MLIDFDDVMPSGSDTTRSYRMDLEDAVRLKKHRIRGQWFTRDDDMLTLALTLIKVYALDVQGIDGSSIGPHAIAIVRAHLESLNGELSSTKVDHVTAHRSKLNLMTRAARKAFIREVLLMDLADPRSGKELDQLLQRAQSEDQDASSEVSSSSKMSPWLSVSPVAPFELVFVSPASSSAQLAT